MVSYGTVDQLGRSRTSQKGDSVGSNPTRATMNKFGIINHPGFYRFFCRKMVTEREEKIRNKERLGYRGPKQRYSVWRAEYNKKWEELGL